MQGITTMSDSANMKLNASNTATNTAWSAVQIIRLVAANQSRAETAAIAEDLKGKCTEAKKQRDERQEALLEAISGAEDKHREAGDKPGQWSRETSQTVAALNDDYKRAVDSFELLDRQKRRQDDQVKKLTERVFYLLDENQKGGDLFSEKENEQAAAGKDTFLSVHLADLVGEMLSRPFADLDVRTVGEFIEASRAAEDFADACEANSIKDTYVAYVSKSVATLVNRFGRGDILPKGFEPDELVGVPELEKPAKPAKESKPDGYEPPAGKEGDAGKEKNWADIPFHAWPARIGTGDLQAVASLLDSYDAETPAKFLTFLATDIFTARDPDKIAEAVPEFTEDQIGFVCNCIAEGLHNWADPDIYDLVDKLDAMCTPAFETLCEGSDLLRVARRPADQRYGRLQPVEHVDADGHVTREMPRDAHPVHVPPPPPAAGPRLVPDPIAVETPPVRLEAPTAKKPARRGAKYDPKPAPIPVTVKKKATAKPAKKTAKKTRKKERR